MKMKDAWLYIFSVQGHPQIQTRPERERKAALFETGHRNFTHYFLVDILVCRPGQNYILMGRAGQCRSLSGNYIK